MGVFGVGRGSDEGAAVVGRGEAGAGGGDSSGAQNVEGGRGERRGMGPCGLSQGEGGGGSISRPIRLSSILRSGYWRRFGGG
jgi:hypothetical protein